MDTSRVGNQRDTADPKDLKPMVVQEPGGATYSIYVSPVASFSVHMGKHGGRGDSLRILVVGNDGSTFEAGTFDQDESARARRRAKVVADDIASGKHVPGKHSRPSSDPVSPTSFWVTLLGSLAASGTLLVAASHVATTPWHVALVALGVIASLYSVYLLAIVAFLGLLTWMIDQYSKPRAKRVWAFRSWPFWVWPIVALLGLTWPPVAALSGYDASEWLWQGLSVYAGILVVLAIFFRRRAGRR